jgi:hypothetical protein
MWFNPLQSYRLVVPAPMNLDPIVNDSPFGLVLLGVAGAALLAFRVNLGDPPSIHVKGNATGGRCGIIYLVRETRPSSAAVVPRFGWRRIQSSRLGRTSGSGAPSSWIRALGNL